MVGAYGAAITVDQGGSLWLGVLVGILASVVLGLIFGLPTLRLRADYLAIVTIATAEIIRFLARSVALREVTGGSYGLTQFARDFYALNPLPAGGYGLGLVQFGERQFWLLLVAWTLVGLACGVVFLLMRSPWGRLLRAIRDDEDVARSLGKNVYAYKLQSLVFGGLLGSVAGFILAIGTQSVQPDTYSSPITFFAYTVLILGGAARVLGPVVGSMVFWALLAFTDNVLRQAVDAGFIPSTVMDGTQVAQVRFMLVGLGLILLMVYRPQGLFGDRNELALEER
jgi:branched-chain amino acid transport system permease protein